MFRLGIELIFEETKVRGTDKTIFSVHAISDIDGNLLHEYIDAKDWDDLKTQYPTLKDLLIKIYQSDYFRVLHPEDDGSIFIVSIEGHKGLYDFKKKQKEEVIWSEIPKDLKRR